MNPKRTPIIAGNWKMYKTAAECRAVVTALKQATVALRRVEIVVCPPFTSLGALRDLTQDGTVQLGAQNIHWEKEGAFTGEISGPMLQEYGVTYAIVGHSERRQYFRETNETVNKRARAALAHRIHPIVCVGELLQQREAGQTSHVVSDQIMAGLAGFSKTDMLATVIAYEPVWAIGTGQTASPQQAQDVHKLIRDILESMFDAATAAQVRIQYGGSVKPNNAKELMAQADIDGALVGGASLDATSFADIIRAAASGVS